MMKLISFSPVNYQLFADAKISDDLLFLSFALVNVSELPEWPEQKLQPSATDKLYTTTCFEAFLKLGEKRYLEINLSPSGDWQYYWFDDYRTPGVGQKLGPPKVKHTNLGLEARVPVNEIMDFPTPCLTALSAVVAFPNRTDYWALVHCGEKPDFHILDSFVLPV